jgi:hypothetical protein
MKSVITIALFVSLSFSTNAQTLTAGDSTLFDFWIGEWSLAWKNANGTDGKGVNLIERTLDGKVIQENFKDVTGFKGTSISVLSGQTKTWKQAWADNQGGYLDFEAFVENDKRGFMTKPRTVNNKIVVQRMVFYNIKQDSFTWDWEGSQDGGKTWNLNWRIQYTRKK